jgi:predicted Zn-dependent protease
MRKFFLIIIMFYSLQVSGTHTFPVGAVIRDAEIEEIMLEYLRPIAKIAGLNDAELKVYVIVDPQLNAFATFNTTIFFTTGTLLRAESPSEIIGVGAHEMGHIAGLHLVRRDQAIENASKKALLGVAAGIILGLITQRPDVGMAGLLGGQTLAMQGFLKYSQGEETTADNSGLQYLSRLGWPTDGFLRFMQRLQNQELLSEKLQDPYARTHPISRHRVESIRYFTKKNEHLHNQLPIKFYENFKRLQVKLEAFLAPPGHVLAKYQGSTPNALLAQAVAYHLNSEFNKSLGCIEKLTVATPQDPFVWELKGQILLESGKPEEAIPAYQRAVELSAHSPLIKVGLVQTMIATDKDKYLTAASQLIEKILKEDPESFNAYYLLAVVEGRKGNMGKMALALSKEAALQEDWERAKEQADRAKQHLKSQKEKQLYLQADDLHRTAKQKLEDAKNRKQQEG